MSDSAGESRAFHSSLPSATRLDGTKEGNSRSAEESLSQKTPLFLCIAIAPVRGMRTQ